MSNVNLTLRQSIKPSSDRLNVEDFLGGETMVQIQSVELYLEKGEVKMNVYIVGGDGRPYKPCKSMRKLLFAIWGEDENGQASHYAGRWINLYVDPNVDFGNQKNIGGIRINAASHIPGVATVKLQVRRGVKQEFKVQPIQLEGNANNG